MSYTDGCNFANAEDQEAHFELCHEAFLRRIEKECKPKAPANIKQQAKPDNGNTVPPEPKLYTASDLEAARAEGRREAVEEVKRHAIPVSPRTDSGGYLCIYVKSLNAIAEGGSHE